MPRKTLTAKELAWCNKTVKDSLTPDDYVETEISMALINCKAQIAKVRSSIQSMINDLKRMDDLCDGLTEKNWHLPPAPIASALLLSEEITRLCCVHESMANLRRLLKQIT